MHDSRLQHVESGHFFRPVAELHSSPSVKQPNACILVTHMHGQVPQALYLELSAFASVALCVSTG